MKQCVTFSSLRYVSVKRGRFAICLRRTELVLFFVRTRNDTLAVLPCVFIHFQMRHLSVLWLMPRKKILDKFYRSMLCFETIINLWEFYFRNDIHNLILSDFLWSYFTALKEEIKERNDLSMCMFPNLSLIQGSLYGYCCGILYNEGILEYSS